MLHVNGDRGHWLVRLCRRPWLKRYVRVTLWDSYPTWVTWK